jgi:hypothetical protein
LYGSRFQWIIVGYYEANWWLNNPGPCNTSEILQALNGTLQTRVAQFGYNRNSPTMAHLVCLKNVQSNKDYFHLLDSRSISI